MSRTGIAYSTFSFPHLDAGQCFEFLETKSGCLASGGVVGLGNFTCYSQGRTDVIIFVCPGGCGPVEWCQHLLESEWDIWMGWILDRFEISKTGHFSSLTVDEESGLHFSKADKIYLYNQGPGKITKIKMEMMFPLKHDLHLDLTRSMTALPRRLPDMAAILKQDGKRSSATSQKVAQPVQTRSTLEGAPAPFVEEDGTVVDMPQRKLTKKIASLGNNHEVRWSEGRRVGCTCNSPMCTCGLD